MVHGDGGALVPLGAGCQVEGVQSAATRIQRPDGAAGNDRIAVKSHHHQGIGELGRDLTATGWSVGDDLVEAVELSDDGGFVLGVLWHPEEDGHSRVIEALVEAARSGVAAK